jgi:hypothetical protein
MKLTTPGRMAAAPRGGPDPDRATRIGIGALTPPHPLVACGDRSPRGSLFTRRGSREARWSH